MPLIDPSFATLNLPISHYALGISLGIMLLIMGASFWLFGKIKDRPWRYLGLFSFFAFLALCVPRPQSPLYLIFASILLIGEFIQLCLSSTLLNQKGILVCQRSKIWLTAAILWGLISLSLSWFLIPANLALILLGSVLLQASLFRLKYPEHLNEPSTTLFKQLLGIRSTLMLLFAGAAFAPVKEAESLVLALYFPITCIPIIVGLARRCDYLIKLKNSIGILAGENHSIVEKNEDLTQENYQLKIAQKKLIDEQDKLAQETREAQQKIQALLRESNAFEQVRQGIEYARRIQMGMLYSDTEVCKHFSSAFIYQEPRDVVSGDFFWFSKINETQSIIAIADCTGHGVPGAFMTVMGNALLNEIVNKNKVYRPDQILFLLNQRLQQMLKKQESGRRLQDGMDIALCFIDKSQRQIAYSGARNPLCYIRDQKLHHIKGTRVSIGAKKRGKEKAFELKKIAYQRDDMFYLFSDGYQDQLGGENKKKYMARRFRDMLPWLSQLPANEQHDTLSKVFQAWKKDQLQTDDVLVMGFRP